MKRQVYFVLGMHRTGTSVLTKCLSLMGLGLPKSISPGAIDNPKGHFESLRIRSFHDDLLEQNSLSWDSIAPLSEGWFSTKYADKAVETAKGLLAEDYPGNGPIVLKDPRAALFWPIWQRVSDQLTLDRCCVISLRSPLEVAQSLEARNGLGVVHSCLLYINNVLSAEARTRRETRSFIDFPHWARDIQQHFHRLEKDLGRPFPGMNPQNLLLAEREFEVKLVHASIDQSRPNVREAVQCACELYGLLQRLVDSPYDEKVLADIDTLKTAFYSTILEHAALFRELEMYHDRKYVADKAQHNEVLEGLKRECEILRNTTSSLEKEIGQAQRERAAAHKVSKELKVRLETSVEENARLEEINRVSRSDLENSKLKRREISVALQQLSVKYEEELHTVFKPLYRRFFNYSGLLLRKMLPLSFVESIKRRMPDPYTQVGERGDQATTCLEVGTAIGEKLAVPPGTGHPDIFILSIINWDFRHQRPQHIASGLAETGRRVFYVEMELAPGETQCTQIADNLYKVRLSDAHGGISAPYSGKHNDRQLNGWIWALYDFCQAVGATQFKQVIIQHPYWWQFARHLPPEFHMVFDCMDDISGFSNTRDFILQLEHDMLEKADDVIVSSQCLLEKCKAFKTPTLVRNGADLETFLGIERVQSDDRFCAGGETADGRGIRVGYIGAIADWFDAKMLHSVAAENRDFTIHLCGEVTTRNTDILMSLDNVIFYGEIPYSDVPSFIQSMDVMTIPFKIVPIIQACDPVKFYEYCAMGKPTVSTPLPELERAKHLVHVADSPQDFAAQVRSAHAQTSVRRAEDFRRFATENTWVQRVEGFVEVLQGFPKVSIVVLSYGDPALTLETIHSLCSQGGNYPNMEVLLVDNGSSEENVQILESTIAEHDNVVLIKNAENLGFAKGNNVGINQSTGKYIMLLNNDTVVAPGAIHAMVRHLERNSAVGAVGPLTNNIGNEAKLFVEYTDMQEMVSTARASTVGYRGVFSEIKTLAYFAVMFKKDMLEEFGRLSEDYGVGMFEDDDHCAVIRSKGYVCALAEDAFVHHHLSATFSGLGEEKQRIFDENKRVYEKKWGKWVAHKYRTTRPRPTLKQES